MDITVVVCTRNRSCQLLACLDSITHAIESQDKAIEAIIVDNSSTDNTEEIARAWASKSRFPARVFVESRCGVSAARNTAIRNARGNILVFTDDDCSLSQDYFTKLAYHYAQDAGPVIRGGRVELGGQDDADFTTKKDINSSRLSDIAEVAGFILGCNMVLPREAIIRVGRFDERFGSGALFRGAEETDFICRAFRVGIPIEYIPDMIVFHHHGRQSSAEIRRLYFDYCVGKGALYGKYFGVEQRLLRHLYWDSRDAVFEMFGGESANRELGLTYRSAILGNVVGLLLYGLYGRKKNENDRKS